MQVVQCDFVHVESSDAFGFPNEIRQTAWVDASQGVKAGCYVTFKGDARMWKVERVGTILMEVAEINQRWGLDLPKSQRTER